MCTVTQYIRVWADCQQVGNGFSQHFGRCGIGGGGRREEYTHTKYTHTHRNPCTQIVGLEAGYLGIACICEADEEQQ